MARRANRLSAAQQAVGLRSTWGRPLVLRQHHLVWTGVMTPSEVGRRYEVELSYTVGEHPRVRVLQPELVPNSQGWLPHYYHDTESLCLYSDGDWNSRMHLATTILPWTVEWLFHYELWRVTGEWHGSGDDMVWAQSKMRPGYEREQSDQTRPALEAKAASPSGSVNGHLVRRGALTGTSG